MGQDHPPGLGEPLQRPACVGGTGGGKTDGLEAGLLLGVPFVTAVGGAAVAEYGTDLRPGEDGRQVVWHHIPDAAVRRSGNGAASYDVPEGNVVALEHGGFFRDGPRRFDAQHGGQYLPEAVLGMVIKVLSLPGFHRGKGAENENTGIPVKQRRKRMHLQSRLFIPLTALRGQSSSIRWKAFL